MDPHEVSRERETETETETDTCGPINDTGFNITITNYLY